MFAKLGSNSLRINGNRSTPDSTCFARIRYPIFIHYSIYLYNYHQTHVVLLHLGITFEPITSMIQESQPIHHCQIHSCSWFIKNLHDAFIITTIFQIVLRLFSFKVNRSSRSANKPTIILSYDPRKSSRDVQNEPVLVS